MMSNELANFANTGTVKDKYHQDNPKQKLKLATHRLLMALRWRPACCTRLGVKKTIDKE